jgi:hypothetical protein
MYCSRLAYTYILIYNPWKKTYVVPVPTTELQHRGLEAEFAHPGAGLGRVARQGDLARVVVPGAEQVHGLDVGRGAQVELELDGGHGD